VRTCFTCPLLSLTWFLLCCSAAPASPPVPVLGEAPAGRGAGSSSENEARLQTIRARMRALRSQAPPGAGPPEGEPSLDTVDATIVSALFWPPFQVRLRLTLRRATPELLSTSGPGPCCQAFGRRHY
jgi:hypothetical protein